MNIFKCSFWTAVLFGAISIGLIMVTCPWFVWAGDAEKTNADAAMVNKHMDDKTAVGSDRSGDDPGTGNDVPMEKTTTSGKRSVATFDYFLRSGYTADNILDIQAVGKVAGNDGPERAYSVPQKVYVDLLEDKTDLALGDLLVVFDDIGGITESHSGFSKRLIKNLAVVKIREIQKKRCLVEIVKSYAAFEKGARLKPMAREKAFWNKTRIKKNPPDHSIKCFVAQGDPDRDYWNQADYVILTAGSKQGVIEGLIFELRKTKLDDQEESVRGKAMVFFVGPDYAVAEIVSNSESITSGFAAIYKP
jgi:hypothetical protein